LAASGTLFKPAKSIARAEGFLMPIALIILVLDITLVYHSVRTGRARPWAFIILMAPLVGSIAYIGFELVPEWFSSPEAKQARKRFADRIDPEKTYREETLARCPIARGAFALRAYPCRTRARR
jgi:hypothetical protein